MQKQMERNEIIEKVKVALENWFNKGDFPLDLNGRYEKRPELEFDLGDGLMAYVELNVYANSGRDEGDYYTPPTEWGYYFYDVLKISVLLDGDDLFETTEIKIEGGAEW